LTAPRTTRCPTRSAPRNPRLAPFQPPGRFRIHRTADLVDGAQPQARSTRHGPARPDRFGYLPYASVVPTSQPDVARTQITDPTGQTYELQLMDGTSLDDPDRPPATDMLSRLGARIARRFAPSVAQSPNDVQTFTIRVVLLRGDRRELQCTFFTDLMNRDTQIARISDAITTGTFDPERAG